MEWRLAFAEFLLAFCAVVLADRVYGFSGRILAALGWSRPEVFPPAVAAGAGGHDWYVFFYRSRITGEAQTPRQNRAGARLVVRPRRPDSRPRLRV